MPKPWLRLIPLFLLAAGPGADHARAQMPTDSLGGKTVHVFLPGRTIDTLMVQNLNVRMTKDGEYWHHYTFTRAGLYDYLDGFYFTDPSHRLFLSKAGVGRTEMPRFNLSDFQGGKEIWIVVDPAGSESAPPVILTRGPKIVHILNPWPAAAPKLVSGIRVRNMAAVTGHCGWFTAMLLDTSATRGYFSEAGGAGTYGKTGMGSAEDIDFTPLFERYGPEIWLNAYAQTWTGSFPGAEGACGYTLAMTVRDFGRAHPDFEFGNTLGGRLLKGAVKAELGPDPARKPRLDTANAAKDPIVTYGHFDQWWITDSANAVPALRNYESCHELPIGMGWDGLWKYDSYSDSPDHGFWPVEGALNRFNETSPSCYEKPPPDSTIVVTGGPPRNGNFCVESHASFVYERGQYFKLNADDDSWVFIDGKLALDLGGVHSPMSDSADLDKLGLIPGQAYAWDFFHCNREPCSSVMRFKTSIRFRQPRPLFAKGLPAPSPGAVSLELWKIIGGTGSCLPPERTRDSAKAAGLAYRLLDPAGKVLKEMASGSTYYGGIAIAEPVITIDTARMSDGELVPGATYRVIAFDPSNPGSKVEVSFRLPPAPAAGRRPAAKAGIARSPVRDRNVLGRRLHRSDARSAVRPGTPRR